MTSLTRIWLTLIVLIAATVTLAGFGGPVVAAGLLALALAKARVILGGFLGLSGAPGWLAAFTIPLAFWLAAIWGLYAI